MDKKIYCQTIDVTSEVIDELKHVNNRAYLGWMETLAREHAHLIDPSSEDIWVVREHHVLYLKPSYLGECLTVYTWLDQVSGVSARRCYAFFRGEELLVKAHTLWVCVSKTTMKPKRIPEITKAVVCAGPLSLLGEGH